jgi:hypothetical protein
MIDPYEGTQADARGDWVTFVDDAKDGAEPPPKTTLVAVAMACGGFPENVEVTDALNACVEVTRLMEGLENE